MANSRTGFLNQWGGKSALFFTYTHFSHDLTTGLMAALLAFVTTGLNLNYLQAGFLVSAFSLTSGFSQYLGGWVSDRITRQRAMALGLGGVGISSVAVSIVPSYYILLAVMVIMGIFAGFYHPSAVATLTTRFEEQRRGRAVALHMVGGSLGFATGPILGAIIASRLNWHLSFLFLGLPAIIAASLVLTQLKLPATVEPVAAASPSGQAVRQGARSIRQVFRSVAGIVAMSVAMQVISVPIMSFMPLFLVDVRHLSDTAGTMWVTVIRVGTTAGSLAGGWLADRWGRRRTIFSTLVLLGPALYALTALPFGIGLVLIFVVFGLLMNMRETTMQTMLMDNSPPRLRATVFGIYFGFGQQGGSLVQPLAGDFMDSMGIYTVFQGIAYVGIGVSCLAAILALRRTKPAEVGFDSSSG